MQKFNKIDNFLALLTLFLKIFSKTCFYILGEDPRKILEQTEFKYLMWFFEEKSDMHARYSKDRGVCTLLISFLKQLKKYFENSFKNEMKRVYKYSRLPRNLLTWLSDFSSKTT